MTPIFVDSFAGGGGASTGIRLAIGHDVDIAINHDPSAILMHETNHPRTKHYLEDVWSVDPAEACGGRPVALAWFSPDCKHFSRAKGAALVDKNIRGLAWVVLRWAAIAKPDIIMLENVPEFITWGPVRKGKPVKRLSGMTYVKWRGQLESLGYVIDTRELKASDYGVPTSRRRFYLIARRDDQPIVWPKPTHGDPDSPEVRDGLIKPWRNAASVIDWSLPCPSVFDTSEAIKDKYGVRAVRPLRDNTLRRVAVGLDRFVLKSANPFLVTIGYGERAGQKKCVRDIENPINTVKASGSKQYLCTPRLIQYHSEQKGDSARGQALNRPLMTQDASNRYGMQAAYLTEWYGMGRPIDIGAPMHTQTAKDREAVVAANISPYFGGGYTTCGKRLDEPLPTVTGVDHNALEASYLVEFKGTSTAHRADEPLRTVTASIGEFGAVKTRMNIYDGEADVGHWPDVRALLNRFCGYAMQDDEILLMTIGGKEYFVSDIGLRMLTPRELFDAQGFPHDYIIDRDASGRTYPKSAQVARCGNAVCPPVAQALVAANVSGPMLRKQYHNGFEH